MPRENAGSVRAIMLTVPVIMQSTSGVIRRQLEVEPSCRVRAPKRKPSALLPLKCYFRYQNRTFRGCPAASLRSFSTMSKGTFICNSNLITCSGLDILQKKGGASDSAMFSESIELLFRFGYLGAVNSLYFFKYPFT